jgi:hypothetical protein
MALFSVSSCLPTALPWAILWSRLTALEIIRWDKAITAQSAFS